MDWFKSAGSWINSNIVKPVETQVVKPVVNTIEDKILENTCNYGKYPESFTLDQLTLLKINETKESKTGCCPSLSGTGSGSGYDRCKNRGFNYPNNGEFVWDDSGSKCMMCSCVSEGYGCSDCATSIEGKRPKIKRIGYNADVIDCCIKQPINKSIDGNTCHPDTYDTNSNMCKNALYTFCSNGDNIFTNENCMKFCSQNKEWCDMIKRNHCNGQSSLTDNCRNYCKTNYGKCDTIMNKHCLDQKNKDNPDPLCTCINSAANRPGKEKTYNPACIDAKCILSGYQTHGMVTAGACNIVDCSQYFDLKAGGNIEFKDVTLEQRCGMTINDSNNTNINNNTSNTTKNDTSNTTDNHNKTNDNNELTYIIIGGSILAIISIITLIIYVKRKK